MEKSKILEVRNFDEFLKIRFGFTETIFFRQRGFNKVTRVIQNGGLFVNGHNSSITSEALPVLRFRIIIWSFQQIGLFNDDLSSSSVPCIQYLYPQNEIIITHPKSLSFVLR